jgi:hypothetical protein
MPPHSKHAARRVGGLEPALVDNSERQIGGFDGDEREFFVRVAGPAALVVSKSFKVGERQNEPRRLVDKDAHDLYRLLRAVKTEEIVEGFRRILDDKRSSAAVLKCVDYLRELFSSPDTVGSRLAGRAELGIGEPEIVSASVAALVADLLDGLSEVNRN